MPLKRVTAFLSQRGLGDRVQSFAVSSATVELAAQAVGVAPARIAKTLSFRDGEGCLVVVVAGDAKVDNAKFKAQFAQKARMLTADEALAATGYAVGGVCPFALPENVPVYLDASMRRFDTVYPAAGTASSAVAIHLDELYACTGARAWVDVCKGWQEEA